MFGVEANAFILMLPVASAVVDDLAMYRFDFGGPVSKEQVNTVEVPGTLEDIDEELKQVYISQINIIIIT